MKTHIDIITLNISSKILMKEETIKIGTATYDIKSFIDTSKNYSITNSVDKDTNIELPTGCSGYFMTSKDNKILFFKP
jgi:ribosomal protein L1